jgi:hypothetical protein
VVVVAVVVQAQVMIVIIADGNVISVSVIIATAWNLSHVYELDVERSQQLWLKPRVLCSLLQLDR